MTVPSDTTRSLLAYLQQADQGFLSGPVLAAHLGVSRTAVWKQIRKLEALGYPVETHPRKGYRLRAGPDLFVPSEFPDRLVTRWLGRPFYHFLETGSTNAEALQLARGGAPHGTLVVAEKQTAGRGRLDRKWHSPIGQGLTFSLILRPNLPPRAAPQLTLVAASGLAHCIRHRFDLAARIKWPNDILIHHKKAAGILTEMESEADRIGFVVVGIGINCNQGAADLVGPFRYPATSIAAEWGGQIDRQGFLAELLTDLEVRFELLQQQGFSALLRELQDYSDVLGAQVVVESMGKTIAGKVIGLTEEGALKVATRTGACQVIWAGDITRVTHDSQHLPEPSC